MAGKIVRGDWRIALDEAARRLEENRNPESKAYEVVMRHGSMHVGLYAPRGSDPQQPHTQDEVYVVMRGQGLCAEMRNRHSRPATCYLYRPVSNTALSISQVI